jgi:hypothetical protein
MNPMLYDDTEMDEIAQAMAFSSAGSTPAPTPSVGLCRLNQVDP